MVSFRYREECYGSSGGQTDCSILAYDGTQPIGHLDLAYHKLNGRKEAYIKMVEVNPQYRGKGVGAGLIAQLVQNIPYEAIDWGSTTSNGSALQKAMNAKYGTSYKPVEKDEEPDAWDPKYADDLDNSLLYADIAAWRKRQGYADESMIHENLDAITSKYDGKLDKFYVSEKPKYINLSAIVVAKAFRNQGIGSQVMKDLCAYADSLGKIITLTPSSDFGGSVSRLKAFYKSFGFIENKGRKRDFEISDAMYRLPGGTLGEQSPIYPGVRMKVKELKQIIRETIRQILKKNTYTRCPGCGVAMNYDNGSNCFICKACGCLWISRPKQPSV